MRTFCRPFAAAGHDYAVINLSRFEPARLLAWISDDRSSFLTVGALQAVAGTAPVTQRNGKSVRIEFCRACSHPLRKAMDDFARQSVRYSPWAREYRAAQLTGAQYFPSQACFSQSVGAYYLEIVAALRGL